MAKLIIEVSDSLHKAIKVESAKKGMSLKEVVTKLLVDWLAK